MVVENSKPTKNLGAESWNRHKKKATKLELAAFYDFYVEIIR
jgi:hypothetical protein